MRAKILVAAAALTVSSLASAQKIDSKGFYAFGNYGTLTGDLTVTPTRASDNWRTTGKEVGNAWNLGLGYDYSDHFGMEFSYGSVYKKESSNTTTWTGGSNNYTDKTNFTGLQVAFLGKVAPSENVKVFAGPVWAHMQMKEESTSSYSSTGYASSSASSASRTKNLTGLMLGASFALDQRTDLRVSYTNYKAWNWTTTDGTGNVELKPTQLLFGIGVKF